LIWIVLVAVVFVAGGAWFAAKTIKTRLAVLGLGIAGVATYWFIGHPDMADRPLEARLDAIEAQLRTNPEQLDARALIAVVERKARQRPDDPMGYLLIARTYKAMAEEAQSRGMQLAQSGNEAAAVEQAAIMQESLAKAQQAYGETLRRDGANAEAMGEYADLRFTTTGEVDTLTTSLYQGAFAGQPDRFRLGYLAGIGLWEQGKRTEAEALWADLDARAPADGPERQMFAALRQMFGIDAPPSP
jgi:cytochrome c-type biogenesis protein CcmH/NrfG